MLLPQPLDLLISHPLMSTDPLPSLNISINSSLAPFCPRVRNSLIRMCSGARVGVKVTVAVMVAVWVGVSVIVAVALGVSVAVAVGDGVCVAVALGVSVAVAVGV